MKLLQLKDLDLEAKRVLVRFDGDVPVEHNKIMDDFRLKAVEPTIRWCQNHGAQVILLAHRGRPDGKVDPKLSNKILADYFSAHLDQTIIFLPDFHHPIEDNPLYLLENLRFNPGEETNSASFARQLAKLGDVYCNDAFAVSHRAHASIVGIPALLPHVAGFTLQKEVENLTPLVENPERPYAVVLGGAKAEDKSPVIEDLIPCADTILVGGLVAITYIAAQGYSIGAHKVEEEQLKIAQACITQAAKANIDILVPIDFVNQDREVKLVSHFAFSDLMLDIGPQTIELFHHTLHKANTIFWNGAMGKYEDPAFAKGTIEVGRSIITSGAQVRVGSGGDTTAAVHEHHLASGFTFISSGGGSTLEFIAGKKLPGLEVLLP